MQNILGAGSFGLVISNDNTYATKLFYDLFSEKEIIKEVQLQNKANDILQGIVHVPKIHEYNTHITTFNNTKYLYGIKMDKVPIIEPYRALMHMPLGYKQYDLDTIWPKDYRNPVSESNPPRGYYASNEILEEEWEEEGVDLSIEKVAFTMGKALRKLVDNGIIPIDLEWIYSDGKIYLIDFGLCDFGYVDPNRFINGKSSMSLGTDYYVPGEGHRGYESNTR
jgi:hypothetical protein